MRPVAVLVLASLLAAAPAAAQNVGIRNPDEASPVMLFFHLDAHQDFPINTQPPDDRYAADDSLGLLAPTTSCVPDGDGALNQVSKSFHTFYGFSTPGYVEYDFQEQGGPRIHPERGLSRDVALATDQPATLHWYLKTQFTGGDRRIEQAAAQLDDLPVVIPEVTVLATIRSGDEVSVGSEAYNAGDLIAQGASEPMLVAPDTANPHYLPQPDGSHVYEFLVPISFQQEAITADESFNIRVDVYMEVPGCNEDPDAALMSSQVTVHTSPELRPRLEWSIRNPVQIEYIHPQFIGDRLIIHTGFNSPWGNYDVDETPGGITVEINGPSQAKSLARAAFVQRHHEHGHHFEPVDVTYVWPYQLDQATPGEYTLTVEVMNDQRTATASGVTLVDLSRRVAIDGEGNEVRPVSDGEDEGAPGPAMVPVAVALVAAALLLRRRA